jgi:N-acetyl sugar amidotransferase
MKRCTKGLWDETIPGITFDDDGVSNYSVMFDRMIEMYPRGNQGQRDWEEYVDKIKKSGKNKDYDCIIGVSGGTDSSYLLHIAKEYGLRPLAVNLDNGWSSDISVKNIKKVTKALDIDLFTYVIEYEEMKDILASYMRANLPWIDFPTDHAIKSILYRIANKEGLKYILIGQDIRSEGTQPNEWTYGDDKQLKYVHKKFGKRKMKSFPNMSMLENIYLGYLKGIKMLYPFFFINYSKQEAKKMLMEKYGWEYYGGHHHENLFTKFAIAYWMPKKFNMDKRIITLSAQVKSGMITRKEALEELSKPPEDPSIMIREKDYVIKKLDLENEFESIWNSSPKAFTDYPSNHAFMKKIAFAIKPFIKLIFPQMPSYFVQLEEREDH